MNRYIVTTDEQSFEIIFSANFNVLSHTFSANDRMLQFNIETSLEEKNIGEIVIPRNLIDNPYTVLLDGKEISHKLSDTAEISVIFIKFFLMLYRFSASLKDVNSFSLLMKH